MANADIRGATFRVTGIIELQKQFDSIGKMPKKYLTKSAKEGSDEPLKDAKSSAPVGKTGMLKKGIHRKMETPNKRNKAVYRIRWNPKYTEHYLKPSSGAFGGKPPNAYYPHSVEYGFKTFGGKKKKTKHYHFVTKAIERNEKSSTQKIIDSLNDSITQLMNNPK